MSEPILLKERRGAVLWLVLNDPRRMNVLSDEMLDALEAAFAGLREDDGVRAVVLAARGKAFCAGHDLKQMQAHRGDADGGRGYFGALFARCSALMQSIGELPQPVIASVQGVAAAAGCQLVASCDLAVAAEGTRFGVNGIDIGLFCSTPSVALSRNMHRKQAFEMAATGAFLDAQRAVEAGLVNRAVPAEALEAETMALAERVGGDGGEPHGAGHR